MIYSLIRNFLMTTYYFLLYNITASTVNLNNDLTKIPEGAVQWEMNFIPDPSKQAQELLFSQKTRFKP